MNAIKKMTGIALVMMILFSCATNKQPELVGEVPPELEEKLVRQDEHIPYYFPERVEFGDLRDGTYLGKLSGEFIDRGKVNVTVENGVITDVKIEKITLWAPEVRKEHRKDEIDVGLPQQVIDRQSPMVDAVSGATGTTHVFKICVTRALWLAAGKVDPMEAYSPY